MPLIRQIRVVDSGVAFVRRHAELLIGYGRSDLRSIAGNLAVDALMLSEAETVEQFNEWFVVAARGDWLTRNTNQALAEGFGRVQASPEHRQNSCRTPALLAAMHWCLQVPREIQQAKATAASPSG